MKLNKIYCQDCRETMALMPNNFIDLTVTSPPYDNLRTYKGNVVWNDTVWKEILDLLFAKTKQGGVVVWVVNDATINGSETGTSFKQALYAMQIGFNLHDTMIWQSNKIPMTHNRYQSSFEYMFIFSKGKPKIFNAILKENDTAGIKKTHKYTNETNSASFGFAKADGKETKEFGYRKNVWFCPVGGGSTAKDDIAFDHPAIFPEKLAGDHIYSWSAEGDLVYDPFMGSGTVAKMAYLQKRNFIGSEIAEEYITLANKRLEPYLAQTMIF